MTYKLTYTNFKEWKKIAVGKGWTFGKKHDYISRRQKGTSIFTKHGKEYLPLIFETIRMHNPKTLIELGTHKGGLTLALNEEFPGIPIFSFDDRNLTMPCRSLFNENVSFFIEDLLTGENKTLVNLLNSFSEDRIFLYCDNGNKPYEVVTYSKFLKVGDVIGCHDWFWEIHPEDVEEALKDFEWFNIEPWDLSGMLSRFWIKVK